VAATLGNRIRFNTATTGTGTITAGAAVAGFVLPSGTTPPIPDGAEIPYAIEDTGNAWEEGSGIWSAGGGTLTRVNFGSSSTGSLLNLSGSAIVFSDATAEELVSLASLTHMLHGAT
jgi:hypothetical protein